MAAGAFSNDYASLEEKKKSDIKNPGQNGWIATPSCLHPDEICTCTIATRLEKILLSMDQDPEGRRILQRTDGTTKFDALPGGELVMRERLLDAFHSPEIK